MAAVEGFSPAVLDAGLPWTWDSLPSYLDSLEGRIGVNAATYFAHSALRRFVMGERASEACGKRRRTDVDGCTGACEARAAGALRLLH